MVFRATHNDGLAFEVGENAAEVTMQFVAQRFVLEKGRRSLVEKTVCTKILASDCGTVEG